MLQRVGHVEDHRGRQPAQHGETAHVDHQIVIAEGRAALGQPDLRRGATAARIFSTTRAHVIGSQELPLLDVDHAAQAARRRLEQAGLPREKGRDLEAGRRPRPQARPRPGRGRRSGPARPSSSRTRRRIGQPLRVPQTGEGTDGAAVVLAVGGLEDEAHAETPR